MGVDEEQIVLAEKAGRLRSAVTCEHETFHKEINVGSRETPNEPARSHDSLVSWASTNYPTPTTKCSRSVHSFGVYRKIEGTESASID